LNWLLGAYYFHADSSARYYFSAPLFSPDPINDFSSNSEETAYAVFGETGFRLNDQWRLTGGLRLNSEEARVSDVGTGIRDNATLTHAEDHWDNSSWRLAVEYSASTTALAYASISTGFKSGGITTERLPSGEFDGFGPEHLTAYEVGIKMQQAAGRWTLNTAVFLYEFEDMQVLTTLIIDNRLISAVDNAAKAKIYGIDASGNVRITDRLILSAGLVFMPKREFDEFQSDSTGEDLSGNEISRAPAWTTTASISYSRPVAQLGALSATLQYNFRSDFYFSKENVPDMRQSSFGLWNLSLRFEPPSARWYLFASGRNLTDRDYFNQALIQSSPGYPDTYEAGFGVRF
jgi:iron complex outermembrane receptor protein